MTIPYEALRERVAAVIYDAEYGDGRWEQDKQYQKDPYSYYSEPYTRARKVALVTARDVLDAIAAVKDGRPDEGAS